MIVENLIQMEPDVRYQLLTVTQDQLPQIWPHAIPFLLRTKEHWEGFATLEDIYVNLQKGLFQLWMVNDVDEFVLGVLTELQAYPNGTKVLRLLWIGGTEMDYFKDTFLDYIELWAVRKGATMCQIVGRKGWVRKLRSRGYEQTQWIVNKDLTGIKEH